MTDYFTFSEFTRETVIPIRVAQSIKDIHMPELNLLRKGLGHPITISERSGFRSRATEKLKGRSGNSQHCFDDSLGAVDLTCAPEHLKSLGDLLITISTYTRITWYPRSNFYHCDYKPSDNRYYTYTGGKWRRDPERTAWL